MKKTLYILIGFVLGIGLIFNLAAYTRAWDESTPTDATYANQIDDYMRGLREDVAERLENMLGGFSSSDSNEGCYYIDYIQRAGEPATVSADRIKTYTLQDADGVCGLFAKNENGYTKQILKKVGSDLQLNIEATDVNDNILNDTDLRLRNNYYLRGRNAAGTADVNCIKVDANNIPVLEDGVQTESNAAPTQSKAVTNKKYVDEHTTMVPVITGPGAGVDADTVSVTQANGLIMKWGTTALSNDGDNTITFPTAFDHACYQVVATAGDSTELQYDYQIITHTFTASSFICRVRIYDRVSPIHWFAVGY